MSELVAFAPGRVNLIGEHTDYTGGLVFPIALDRGITIAGTQLDGRVRARSSTEDELLDIELPVADPASVVPKWGRFLAAAAAQLVEPAGFDGAIETDLPSGGTGLSTSTALTCASLLMLGADGDRLALARLAKAAEQAATGVQTGMMDQLASLCGQDGHALVIDCHAFEITPVEVPGDLAVWVVHSGEKRTVAESLYSERREACFAAEREIGPLRLADLDAVESIADPIVRKRARHVVGDNGRVAAMAESFRSADVAGAAAILREGHRSYADNFEASTPTVDAMIGELDSQPGVLGARLTGGGFGGSIVVFAEPDAVVRTETWHARVRPSDGARLFER